MKRSISINAAIISKKYINKQSRLFFHIALKKNRNYSLQERRYSHELEKRGQALYFQKLVQLLNECQIILPDKKMT